MSALQLPNTSSVANLLRGLLCKPVAVKPAAGVLAKAPQVHSVGVFVGGTGAIGSLCLCDVAAAAYLGAALSLIPPAVAAEALKKSMLSEGLVENLREVVNVTASLFNVSGGSHVRLRDLLTSPQPFPAEVVSLAAAKAGRTDMEITVPGYGAGKMSFVVL